MGDVMEDLKKYIKQNDNDNLLDEFVKAKKDQEFSILLDTLNLSDKVLCKYTSLLEDSTKEYKNCIKCSGLDHCKNSLCGYRYKPVEKDESLTFIYEPCKYKEQQLKDKNNYTNLRTFHLSENLKNARMKDIYVDDKNRVEIIKLLDSYCDNYLKGNKQKGMYLYGNFGSGKTYLIAALFNELAKNDVPCAMVYFPEFLRVLKSSFSNVESDYETTFSYIKNVPLLLLDDIGAENITSWGRDEVLGTILQYRMDNNLTTFFTSNLSMEELEDHLCDTGKKIDKIKARRLVERIKYLSVEKKLVGVNRRK